MKRLSVIIANYNYESFVGLAIESALALRWPDLEVIVVDDGSTDGSLEVIERYSDRVRVLATANASQRVAAGRGFEVSTGDMVIFLDADDVLPPDLPTPLAKASGAGVSKVQFQMQRIDSDGEPLGPPFPAFRRVPTSSQIRRWTTRTSAYPTPPGSGNAYARWFLEEVMPIDSSVGDFADSALLAAAPFLGDVVTVPGVLVGYRQHGANDSDLLRDHSRFAREIERAEARWRFAQRAAGNRFDRAPLFRSRELLQLRVAAQRLAPGGQLLPGDHSARMATDAATSPFRHGPEPLVHRLLVAAWCLATLVAPQPLARQLVTKRYRWNR